MRRKKEQACYTRISSNIRADRSTTYKQVITGSNSNYSSLEAGSIPVDGLSAKYSWCFTFTPYCSFQRTQQLYLDTNEKWYEKLLLFVIEDINKRHAQFLNFWKSLQKTSQANKDWLDIFLYFSRKLTHLEAEYSVYVYAATTCISHQNFDSHMVKQINAWFCLNLCS